jgi:NADH:ubiquinone oxidoreductase subunit 6 (subunit J)
MILTITVSNIQWAGSAEAEVGTSEKIGAVLFTKYLLPFEVLSLLLLAAVVAAIYLARVRQARGNSRSAIP